MKLAAGLNAVSTTKHIVLLQKQIQLTTAAEYL